MLTRNFRERLTLPLCAALVFVAGCGNDNNNPPQQPGGTTAVTVTIDPGATGKGPAAYGTNPMVVQTGTTVTWVNNDTVPHTATSDTGVWDSGTINPGQNFAFTFTTPGTFPYYCAIHGQASMSGVIEVQGGSPTPTPSVSPTATPSPSPSASPSPSPTASPSAMMVDIPSGATGKGASAYGTNPLVVPRGTTVMWTNQDSVAHTVTADDGSFDSGSLGNGMSFSHTFNTAGDFSYYCSIHGKTSMNGMVRVSP